MGKVRRFRILCIFIFLFTIMPAQYAYSCIEQPRAQEGVLDLSNWDFERDGLVKLQGEWEFYWHELLMAGDFKDGKYEKRFIDIPSSWNGYEINGEKLSGNGYATFRLIIKGMDKEQLRAFKIPIMSTAYKIWVNGKELTGNGVVGKSREEMVPQYLPRNYCFYSDDEIEVIVQVSNFFHRRGGIWKDIYLGTEEQIDNLQDGKLGMQMFVIGCIFVMGLHYLVLYYMRRKDKSALYLGLFCLLVAFRSLFINEIVFIQWFPGFNWELALKLEYLTFYVGVPLFFIYGKEIYPQEVSDRLFKAVNIIAAVFIILVILFPASVYTHIDKYYQLLTLVLSIYAIFVYIKAIGNKREGAVISIVGLSFFLLTVVNDILYYNEIVLIGDLTPIGLIIFILANSFILNYKYSKAQYKAENLARENSIMVEKIKKLNRSLEERIKERTLELNDTIEKLHQEIRERREIEEQLRIYASTDMMTKAFNRAAGMSYLEKQLELAERYNWSLTICYIDINHLKKVNDKYGHQTGDELIINTGKIIRESIREDDVLCRMGGDEFLIIFPQCSIEQVILIWERIARNIDDFNQRDNKYKISMSYGFAETNPKNRLSMKELIARADQEMYKRKNGA